MNFSPIKTIDDVIHALDQIIAESKKTESPDGYFAALYRKVTIKVKEGIANDFFDDGPRMEKLDVVFATRYLDAYQAYHNKQSVTNSWEVAFNKAKEYWPIVLQHLLVGINAHINLDLGIAAAEVMEGKPIDDLKGDFDRINKILSDLVAEVEKDLSAIWPTLKRILKWTKKVDDFLIDFSMEIAREGAWKFAITYHAAQNGQKAKVLHQRDLKVANNARIIFPKSWIIRLVLSTIRLGEKGTVAEKIAILES